MDTLMVIHSKHTHSEYMEVRTDPFLSFLSVSLWLKVCPDKSQNKASAEQEQSINTQLIRDKQARVLMNNSLITI